MVKLKAKRIISVLIVVLLLSLCVLVACNNPISREVEKIAQYSQSDLPTQGVPYSKAECINKCLGERIVFTRPKRLLYTYAHFRKNLILIKNAYFIKHYTMAHNHKPFYIQTPFECNNSCDYFIFNLHRVII
jgi:hypothetical protein